MAIRSRNTIRRAVKGLSEIGYVQSVHGKGVVVIYQKTGWSDFSIGVIESLKEAARRNGAEYQSSDECFLPEEGSLTMELKHAYPIDAGIIRYRRTCGIKDGVISVTEDMLLCESKAVDFILMTTEKPLAQDGRISLCHGVVLNYPPSLAVTVEEIDPVGINTAAVFGTEKLHRIHLLGSFSEAKLQFTLSKK